MEKQMEIKPIDEIEKIVKKVYALTDAAIEKQLKEKNLTHVCSKGCSACCESMDLSVMLYEMDIIKNFIKNMEDGKLKNSLINKMKISNYNTETCPFLIDNICGIYEVRPLVCRTYFIQNQKCEAGEDILETRFDDFIRFDREELMDALKGMYKLYGFNDEETFLKSIYEGFLFNNTYSLYKFNLHEFS